MDLKQLEEDVVNAAREVLHKAAAAEPTVADVVESALIGAGVPAVLVDTAKSLVSGLLGHWQADHAPAAPAAPAAEAPPADLFPADEPPAAADPPAAQNYV